MSNDIRTVANRFIALDIMHGKRTPHIRIHKLCFLAHGWSLALLDRPITFDTASLYKFGPVYDKIYSSCINVGSGNVSVIHENDINHKYHDRGEMFIANFSKEDESLIDAVYNSFKDWESWQLSSHVYNEKKTWYARALNLRDSERLPLKNDEIKKEFLKLKKQGEEEENNGKNFNRDNHISIDTLDLSH